MAKEVINKDLGKGIVTIPYDAELIPQQASQDSLGFISTDGQIELCKGRLLIGAEETSNGYVKGHTWANRADGTLIQFRKVNTKIQYCNDATDLWVDIITGLTSSAEYSLSPYTSTAGTFVYATGIDGVFKIHTANLGSYCTMYGATDIYRGKSIITGNRMFMWDLPNSKTGLYGSRKDAMELVSGNYTAVSGEATTSLSGTLAFKAGDAKRSCFAVVITLTVSGEIYRDDLNGGLVGSLGGTGTINYITGAYTLSNAGVGTASYQWEMTNNKGVTDFTYSATRIALEGFILNLSEGGDFIQTVKPYDNKFYAFKNRTVYELTIDSTDTTFNLTVFRRGVGLEYWRSAVSTGKGIIFMDTANPEKPRLTILQKNITGDNLEPNTLADHFDFSNYIWDACAMDTYGEFIVFSGRRETSDTNDRLFLYNVRRNTVDVLPYGAKTIAPSDGLLYIGDTLTDNVYEILSGFDDDNGTIENYWISNDERYGTETLKKLKKLRIKGLITPDQVLEVSVSYDDDEFTLVGTIRGDGSYVDQSESYAIGSQGIGTSIMGGEASLVDGNKFFAELKIDSPKFRKRAIKLEATGLGYLAINMIDDFNIMTFQQKIPSKYRSKQNVSLDGVDTNVGAPYISSIATTSTTTIAVTLDQACSGTALTGWTVYVNGVERTINSAVYTTTSLITLTLASAVASGDVITATYRSPGVITGVSKPLPYYQILSVTNNN